MAAFPNFVYAPGLAFLAICAATAAPPEKIRVDSHVAVPMRDGVKLYADVYRPAREGKYPVLVIRTPYGVQRDGVHQNVIHFAQNGYAVVNQDVRGRFESEGKWEPFRNEGRDGYDTIEWAAKQPWSNGKVATNGGSYLGHVQWAAAGQSPPSLVTLFPAVASTNIYNNWAYLGGAFRLAFNFGWGVARMPFRIMLPQYWHTEAYAPDDWKYAQILRHLPLRDSDLESSHSVVQHYRDWMRHQSYDDYWREISDEERFAAVKVPAHTQGGWYDIFLAGTIRGFTGMRQQGGSERARRESKMTIGPWGHGPSRSLNRIDYGAEAMWSLYERELRWYNHYLKGEDNGIDREAPVQIFFMGANRWAHFTDWPLPGTRYTPYYFGAKTLRATKPAEESSDRYTYDPNDPVPTLGGNNCCGVPTAAGPLDQRPIESRDDVLGYTSEALTQPLAIAGPVRMKLYAATDGPDTDWMVKLIDVYPDGRAINVCEGILRARFHKGLDHVELLKPGEAYEFDIDMVGTANVFLPGHRVRVDVTSSDFPQFDRNPNTGADLGADTRVRVARQQIFRGGARASHILLPVVDLPPKL